jgi:hypothetical protein
MVVNLIALLFPLILIIIFGVFSVKSEQKRQKRKNDFWLRLANRLELYVLLTPTGLSWWKRKLTLPELQGKIKGRTISVRHIQRRHLKFTNNYFTFTIQCNTLSQWNLQLSRDVTLLGSDSFLNKIFAMQDILIGDPVFDQYFIVQSDNEASIKQALQESDIRRHLLTHCPHTSLLRINEKEGELYYEQLDCPSEDADFEKWVRKLEFFVELAERWEEF